MNKPLITTCLALALSVSSTAYAANEKVMMILDESGSMWGQIDGTSKIEIAQKAIGGLLNDWKSNVELGVMAYGHREKGSCDDIELIAPVGAVDAAALSQKINALQPKGKTPIAGALRKAAEQLKHTEEKATVILVSDGLETCDADPCAVAKELNEAGVDFTTHVVGFDLKDEELKQLKCIADNTGGTLIGASGANELNEALGKVKQAVVAKAPEAEPEPEPTPPESNTVFNETFDAGWEKNWTVVNEDDESYVVDNGKLMIVSQHSNQPYPINAVRLNKPLPEGDWTATVTTTLEGGNYTGFGMMLGNPTDEEKIKTLYSGAHTTSISYVQGGSWYRSGDKKSESVRGMTGKGNVYMSNVKEYFGDTVDIQLVRKGREYYTRMKSAKQPEWINFGAVGVIKPLSHLHLVVYESRNAKHDVSIEFDDLIIETGAAF